MDAEHPQYTQATVLKVLGVNPETWKAWNRREILTDPRPPLPDSSPAPRARGAHRRYSILDIIKLSCIRQLVSLGVPIRIASNFGPLIQMALWREDIDEIEQGCVQRVPMLLAVDGEQLRMLFWRPLPTIVEGISSGREIDFDPMAAMADLGHRAAYVLDWAGIVDDVIQKLEAKVE